MIPRAQYRELELIFRSALRNELAPVLAEIVLLRERVEGLLDRRRGSPVSVADLPSRDEATVRAIAQTMLGDRAEPAEPTAIAAALTPAAAEGARRRYTDEEVRRVKRVFAETGSPTKTAERLGIPVGTVNSMRIAKRWDALDVPPVETPADASPVPAVEPMPSPAEPARGPATISAAPADVEIVTGDALLRILWPDPKVRRMDIAARLGVPVGQIDRRAAELGLGTRPLGGTPPVPMPPPDRKALEAVPGSAEDARDWLFAQLKRERKSEAEIEMMMEQASVKTIFAACNARRVKLGLPPYVQLERSA